MTDLLAALCLVMVIEGLALLAAPRLWRALAEQLASLPERNVRIGGAVMVGAGLLLLQVVR